MPPVTRKMYDPRDAWEYVLAKALLYGENGHLRYGLMALLGIEDTTDFLSIELEEFKAWNTAFIQQERIQKTK
jgi:hypothetical protein